MNRKAILFVLITLLVSGLFHTVSAQVRSEAGITAPPAKTAAAPDASSPQEPSKGAQVSAESADIAIQATVTARELRFDVVPNPIVEFPGKPRRDTSWDAERENLPRPVEPGVTYRNIGIRLKIVSRFADIERIVAEALGETPVTDETPPLEKAAPQTSAPPPLPSSPPASSSRPNGRSPR